MINTWGKTYTDELIKKQLALWKRFINVQMPYCWNLQHLKPGLTLEIGCGIGRNLAHLKRRGIGIDHNPHSVQVARSRGLTAFTPEEFKTSSFNVPGSFDSLLLSHVIEHMNQNEMVELLRRYTYLLKPDGKLIIITPQEAGSRQDKTHMEFMDFKKINEIVERIGFSVLKEYSFPFPRVFGKFFAYNEFVSVSRLS